MPENKLEKMLEKISGKKPDASGQIVVEYVLLLLVAIAIGFFITQQMVNRSSDSPGFLIQAWDQINTAIGNDPADDLQ